MGVVKVITTIRLKKETKELLLRFKTIVKGKIVNEKEIEENYILGQRISKR